LKNDLPFLELLPFENLFELKFHIKAPEGCPYEGKKLTIILHFPLVPHLRFSFFSLLTLQPKKKKKRNSFPDDPPSLRLVPPFIYHLNVDEKSGLVNIPVLSTTGWAMDTSIGDIIHHFLLLLKEPVSDSVCLVSREMKEEFDKQHSTYIMKAKRSAEKLPNY
jgi:ubiquitin-protein ligase